MQERFGRDSGLGSVVEERQEEIDSTVATAVDGRVDTLGVGEQERAGAAHAEDRPPTAEQKTPSGQELNGKVEDETWGHDAVSTVGAAGDMPLVATKLTEEDGLSVIAGATGEPGLSDSSTDDTGDEDDRPQPLRVVGPPADFDWHKLKPRLYGKSLPPLDPVDRQNLKMSIENRGFLGKILIDELLNILDGNTRWEICMETGIAPAVEVVQGLSENKKQRELEKEALALSCNVDRRQLDKDDAVQVFEARLDNFLELRRTDKKLTQERIASALGISVSTVSARERFRHDSDGGTMSKPDARRKYTEAIEHEAVRLVEEGMPNADVARTLMVHPKAVQRAWNKEKKRRAASTATKPTKPIEDIEASDGVPELHRRALKHLKLDTQAYINWLKDVAAETRQEVEGVSGIEEMQNYSLCSSLGMAFGNFRFRKMLSGGGETDVEQVTAPRDSSPDKSGHEPDTILRGSVIAIEGDEVFLALPVGGGGVIDTRDDCLDWHFPPKVDEVVRVRVGSFDWKRGLWKLQPVARQTPAPAPGAIATGSDRDERRSPYADLAGRKAGPKEFRA